MKLTKPQIDLLTHAVACGMATCVENYPPRMKLVALGLVTAHSKGFSSWIEPTEAGRLALDEIRKGSPQ